MAELPPTLLHRRLGTDLALRLRKAGFRGIVCIFSAVLPYQLDQAATRPGVDLVLPKFEMSLDEVAMRLRRAMEARADRVRRHWAIVRTEACRLAFYAPTGVNARLMAGAFASVLT